MTYTAPLFTETEHCTGRRERGGCKGCRSSIGFRRALARVFRLPDNNVNFDCPHGVPWVGDTPAPATVGLPTPPTPPPPPTPEQLHLAAERHKVCATCPAREDLTDTTVTCRRCRRCNCKKVFTRESTTCPEDKWEVLA